MAAEIGNTARGLLPCPATQTLRPISCHRLRKEDKPTTTRAQKLKTSHSEAKPLSLVETSERLKPCTAALAAIVPLLMPMSAAASDGNHLLQVASPWLSITLGALAFAAAAPERLGHTARKPAYAPSAEQRSLCHQLTASQQDSETPMYATVSAASRSKASWDPERTFGLDKEENQGSTMEALAEPELPAVFANDEPEAVGMLQDGSASMVEEEHAMPEAVVKNNIVEWTGLDAGEQPNLEVALAHVNGKSVSLCSQDAEGEVAADADILVAQPVASNSIAVAELPDEASPAAPIIVNEAKELQREYNTNLAALKASQNSQTVATMGSVDTKEDKAEALKRSYDAKLAALKETAAKKDQDERRRWEARFNVVERIRTSAKTLRQQHENAQPSLSLVKLTAPARSLATMTPRAMLTRVWETFIAIWNWLKISAKKIKGPKQGVEQLQY